MLPHLRAMYKHKTNNTYIERSIAGRLATHQGRKHLGDGVLEMWGPPLCSALGGELPGTALPQAGVCSEDPISGAQISKPK